MAYDSLEACIKDLENTGQLIRIKEEVDANLEMAAIHLKVFAASGPALLFEKVKGSQYRACSNIFGTLERSKYIFRDTLPAVQEVIRLRNDPMKAIKSPLKNAKAAFSAMNALPLRNPGSKPVLYKEIKISDLPMVKHWPMDGGAFVTLPQVYTEDVDAPGIMNANLGMYRIQLNGNDYILNDEIGLHYQLHRGIGVHQFKAVQKNLPLKVSIFIGGPPAHTVAAVMPLPEGLSEMTFAGLLGGRRFRYVYKDGFAISTDADFVITGEVGIHSVKPEGPFGDHLGYYSLKHDFPLMKVHKVYAKQNAIWPFTVVGRPPQEDTSFGQLIHEITGDAIRNEIPGLKEVHAVDAAGVHPVLLAIGTERYTPYTSLKRPAELLTLANRIFGTGQLSLAKFLFIIADGSNSVSTSDIPGFLKFVLERIVFERDVHFQTKTTIDTLDYSGEGLNEGSKVIFAAHGDPIRKLSSHLPDILANGKSVLPGIIALKGEAFTTYEAANSELDHLTSSLYAHLDQLNEIALIVLCDDPHFTAETLNNFLWVTFTRSNPANDIYGVGAFVMHKHWGCKGPLIIDARKKPFHAPPLEVLPETLNAIAPIFEKGGSLYGKI